MMEIDRVGSPARRPPFPVSGLLALAVLVACEPGGRGDEGADRGAERASGADAASMRNIIEPRWDTLWAIGGALGDTTLLQPRGLAAGAGMLAVYDDAGDRLKVFGDDGTMLWRFGRSGDGPGEFRNAIDVEIAPDGSVWVMDGGTTRLTRISGAGEFMSLMRLEGRLYRDVIPLKRRLLATPVSESDTLWVRLDSLGREIAAGRFPVAIPDSVPFPLKQSMSAVSPDHAAWGAIFPFGDTFLIYNGTNLRCSGRLVEGDPFPEEPTRRPAVWAIDVVFTESSLVVLPRGETDDRLRLLDEYSATNCRYVRSLRLPGKIQSLAWADGVFFVSNREPVPVLHALRPESQN